MWREKGNAWHPAWVTGPRVAPLRHAGNTAIRAGLEKRGGVDSGACGDIKTLIRSVAGRMGKRRQVPEIVLKKCSF